MKTRALTPFAILAFLSVCTLPGFAQNWNEVIKKVAPNREAGDLFGLSVAIYGDYAVVGARGENEDASGANTLSDAGAAYIFKKDPSGTDNWTPIQKLVASDRGTSDLFGSSVAIFGDYVVVGAYSEDEDALGANTLTGAGAAYVFKKDPGGADNWGQIQKLVASDRGANDLFGSSVAIYGDYVVVGASSEDEDASGANTLTGAGAVYVFKKDQGGPDHWGQIQKLVASDREANDAFGSSVAIYADYAVIGASSEDEDALGANTLTDAGAVYVFKKDQGGPDHWGQIQKLVASDREADDALGSSVAIYGDYVVAGAYMEKEVPSGAGTILLTREGAAYLFKKDPGGAEHWGQIQKLVASDGEEHDVFGRSVAISGDYVVVGASSEGDDGPGASSVSYAGAAYMFKKDSVGADNWEQIQKLVASDRGGGEFFGSSVAISGDYMVAGAPGEMEDASGANPLILAGAVYVFYNDKPSAVADIHSRLKLRVYPNPATTSVNITWSGEREISITLIDLRGKTLRTVNKMPGKHALDLSHLTAGLYFLQIASGETVTTLKLMKE